ncbi:MAG: 3-deoxy-7-phosphoheptulonate synthase [Planctomycetes bacterium]|nr:3-deoxy-7-phosphoheptulonate synthase [Planctomycetota bacterium]
MTSIAVCFLHDAPAESVQQCLSLLGFAGPDPRWRWHPPGLLTVVLAETPTPELLERVRRLAGLRSVVERSNGQGRTTRLGVDLGGGVIAGAGRLCIVAGPCSVEGRTQIEEIAALAAENGADAVRGGAFKPRSSPYSFGGLGEAGLELLAAAGARCGLPVVTEVLDAGDLDLVARYADVLQIGSRNMHNSTLLFRAGCHARGRPVLLKRGMAATLEETRLAAEYVQLGRLCAGFDEPRLMLCERGVRTFEPEVRFALDVAAIPLLQRTLQLPVIADPSHAAGQRDLVEPLARAAVAAGADGLLIEVHTDPDRAWSDGAQTLGPAAFGSLVRHVRALVAVVALLMVSLTARAQGSPFESSGPTAAVSRIDALVDERLRQLGLEASPPCSDGVFVRRVHLAVLGTLPTAAEARAFLADDEPDKRSRLVDAVLDRPEFAAFQAMRWCDLLRVKAEFPINLWPNAVQAYQRWIEDSLRRGMPYDQFVRTLLLATGSNFRAPESNFLRAVADRTPAGLAKASALTFLGARIESWPQERRDGLASCFAQVAYKSTLEWKEEIVFFDPTRPLGAGKSGRAAGVVLPDGSTQKVEPGADPRIAFTDWLLQEPSHWLARSLCNRIWFWLFGRGVVHEVDDLRADNEAAVPGLLEHLAAELLAAQWDQKRVFREILLSATWQRSPLPRSRDAGAAVHFAHYSIRRLEAEVLIDAICQITGTSEEYSSPIPEPFTVIPPGTRAIALADGSTTSAFLELFGRPPRDLGLASERNDRPTAEQCLHLLNSSHVRKKLESGPAIVRLLRSGNALDELYLTFLSRFPTAAERDAIRRHATAGNPRRVASDVAWALLNSAEFLYQH